MLYVYLRFDFCSTSDWLYPNMRITLRLIRARPIFYKISDNPKISLGIVDSSFYTRRIALKDHYQKKRTDLLRYSPVEFSYLETVAKTFINRAKQNQFIQENIFTNAPVRRIAIATNTNSAFRGSYTENLSRINSLLSVNLKYSEVVSQLSILILQIIAAFMLQQ